MQKKSAINIYGLYTIKVVDQNGVEKQNIIVKNKVPDVIMEAIIENMFDGTPASGFLVSHVAVGSGTTAPAAGDTTLETEIARVAIASLAYSGKVGTCSAVFGAGVATGTHTEIGVFAEASLTPDSGILCSRTAVSITVGALDSLFIDWQLTISEG